MPFASPFENTGRHIRQFRVIIHRQSKDIMWR